MAPEHKFFFQRLKRIILYNLEKKVSELEQPLASAKSKAPEANKRLDFLEEDLNLENVTQFQTSEIEENIPDDPP